MAFLLLLVSLASLEGRTSTVGLPARINGIVVPGSELEPLPLTDRKTPVVLRVLRSEPLGDGFAYDFEYTGLEPGSIDLTKFLRRKDRSPLGKLPALTVTINSVLVPGKVEPAEVPTSAPPAIGGYGLLVRVLGIAWCLGLLAIVFLRRGTRKSQDSHAVPVSLADRLRPLVEDAVAGRVDKVRLAELERTLIVYWTRTLKLTGEKPLDAMNALRKHPEAGPMLGQLDAWLHRPGKHAGVDVGKLLEPYRHLPPETLAVEAA